MSSFAWRLALSEMSNASISPGEVWKGSNSSKWPSAVGTATRAARGSGNEGSLGEDGGEGVRGSTSWGVDCEEDALFRIGMKP